MGKRSRFQSTHAARSATSRADDVWLAQAKEAALGRSADGRFAKKPAPAVVVVETRQQRRYAARMAAKKGGESAS